MALKHWFLAVRPKTLLAGVVPVMVASALAYHDECLLPTAAFLCLVFSLLSQIASNLSNDYYDYLKDADNEMRIGPARAVSSGWIKPQAMRLAVFVVVAVACLFGLGLVAFGGWKLIIVGMFCVVALLAYSAGPYPLSYHALGDLFVLVFFGVVAVVFTYYVQSLQITCHALLCGVAVGLTATNILVVNNYRDYENDKDSGKCTTIVLLGRKFGSYFYLLNGIVACGITLLLAMDGMFFASSLPLLYLLTHLALWRVLKRTTDGGVLNSLLAKTSLNLFFYGSLLSVGMILD